MDDHRLEPQVLLSGALAAVLLLAIALPACSKAPPADVRIACPGGDPLRGIYSPGRLTVLGTCRWFRGIVLEEDRRSDGDLHMLLRPDPGFSQLLNVENVNAGGMIVEIVPGQQIPEPAVGAHVAVLGTWVLDEHNGWNEIHPIWAIRNLTTGAAVEALPPASPAYGGGGKD